jgi:hypothetical protein
MTGRHISKLYATDLGTACGADVRIGGFASDPSEMTGRHISKLYAPALGGY